MIFHGGGHVAWIKLELLCRKPKPKDITPLAPPPTSHRASFSPEFLGTSPEVPPSPAAEFRGICPLPEQQPGGSHLPPRPR
jgi:hypothetical protein